MYKNAGRRAARVINNIPLPPNNFSAEAVEEGMKKKILILLGVIVAVSAPLTQQAQAVDFSISVGDRPYYHGGGYWHQGYYWVWVPGHHSHRYGRWVPGHYVRRGGYNSHYARTHYRNHRVWTSDRDWR